MAIIMSLFMMMSGCTQPTGLVGDPYSEEPTPYVPTGVVGPLAAEGGAGRAPGWDVYLQEWSKTLPKDDATLEFTIEVAHFAADWPFNGDDWRIRLSVLNGTVQVPPEADWYRTYTLTGEENSSVRHGTSFQLGHLDGTSLVLRMTLTHYFNDGNWTAEEYKIWYSAVAEEGYEFDGINHYSRCTPGGANATCPWSGLPAEESPPPPPDW